MKERFSDLGFEETAAFTAADIDGIRNIFQGDFIRVMLLNIDQNILQSFLIFQAVRLQIFCAVLKPGIKKQPELGQLDLCAQFRCGGFFLLNLMNLL